MKVSNLELFAIFALLSGFIAVVVWFGEVDFYHRHFFDTGLLVLVDNSLRALFVLLLSWLVYAPGAGIVAATELWRNRPIKEIWPAERAVLGFGIGVGIWQLILLILGELNLYYRSVMIALCAAVLLASAKHFGEVISAGWGVVVRQLDKLRAGQMLPKTAGIALVVFASICLLLVRGLYPGGGGDYYTHYFYYYLEVLKNHGLAPNDVWYHYWYSKGYGLFFLAMILTDPEAPALVTFCCVAFAALAIWLIANRLTPSSLWPELTTLIYLLFNLVSISHGGGGEFQKDHEQISALLTLVAWALCMELLICDRMFVFAAAATGIAAAIITQPMGILISLFLAFLTTIAVARRWGRDVWAYGLATVAIGGTILAIFLLSYLTVGLAADQPLNLMLRFANMARLDRWGVIPQLVLVAWIRDNYADAAPPLGWVTVIQLGYFLRVNVLWCYFCGIALFALFAFDFARSSTLPSIINKNIRAVVIRLGVLLITLCLVSIAAGRVQSVTYQRFSTFFVPLLLLIGVAVCGWVMSIRFNQRLEWVRHSVAPTLVFVAVLASWQSGERWFERSAQAIDNGLRFFSGANSLATAYSRQDQGPGFGGINPEALAAWRHADPPAPIWATNVDSYCMAPDCVIKSVSSFNLPHFDEIVDGSPDRAKELLQKAGINYFLFVSSSPLIDILPYSQLFAPRMIGQYLGLKWTDGSAYLLTWRGPKTKPLEADFYQAYAKSLAKPQNEWFQFDQMAPEMSRYTVALRMKKWGSAPVFPWQVYSPAPGDVYIVDATYGQNCGVSKGNWTRIVRKDCSGSQTCKIRVDVTRSGDPASGCDKDFSISYRCAPDGMSTVLSIPPRADGHSVILDCTNKTGIRVFSASYGKSCKNFKPHPPFSNAFVEGNATNAAMQACDGKQRCEFRVDAAVPSDPVNGCAKDFSLVYACRPHDTPRVVKIPGPADDKVIVLRCSSIRAQKTESR